MPLKACLIFFLLPALHPDQGFAQDTLRIPVTDFDPDQLGQPEGETSTWDVLTLPKRDATEYERLLLDGEEVIRAVSTGSASGLVYKVDIDPYEYPIIEWRWKVEGVLKDGDLRSKKGDDYPARIYITFDYDKRNLSLPDRVKYGFIRTFTKYNIPLRAINYIWANKAEKGTIAPNAYTDWVYMIAVESGNANAGQWILHTQNIIDDYKKAFGEDPPRINGVAIMTDSDDTKGSATAYYGDIIFRKE